MICKCFVATAMASLIAVGTWIHSEPSPPANSNVSLGVNAQEDGAILLNDQADPPSRLEAIHEHLHEVHEHVHHVHESLFSSFMRNLFMSEDIDVEIGGDEFREVLLADEVIEEEETIEGNFLADLFSFFHEDIDVDEAVTIDEDQ